MVVASAGYDLPAFEKLTTFKVWAEEGPPKGTLYHYPEPAQSPDPLGRGRARAAQDRASDLHPGHHDQDGGAHHQGEAMARTLAWAEGEIEGFMRG